MKKISVFIACIFLTSIGYAEEERSEGLNHRMSQLELENSHLLKRIAELESNSSQSENEAYSRLYTKITDLEERLRDVNGRLQHSEYTSKQLIAKLSNLTEDMNYRFTKLENDDKGGSSVKSLEKCISLYEDGKYKEARNALNSYISNASGNDKGEAYYWMGKVYMTDKIYKEAGTYFLKSYKYYPANSKAADSLLNLAVSLKHLDKRNRACSILSRLDLEYPNRPEESKQLSQEEQKALNCG